MIRPKNTATTSFSLPDYMLDRIRSVAKGGRRTVSSVIVECLEKTVMKEGTK